MRIALAALIAALVGFSLWIALADAPWEDDSPPQADDRQRDELRCQEALDLRQQVIQRLPTTPEAAGSSLSLYQETARYREILRRFESIGIQPGTQEFSDALAVIQRGLDDPAWQPSNDFERRLVAALEEPLPASPTPVKSELQRRLDQADDEIATYC